MIFRAPVPSSKSLQRLVGATLLLAALAPSVLAETGEPATQPLCCAVPPREEATADHLVGRWVVTEAAPGAPVREGQRLAFRRDGAVTSALGACRYSILRGELTVVCPNGTRQGTIEFVDDDKVVWRVEGEAPVTIETAE
jgi:hypothetical protein